jgi:hypothetical protein
MNSKSELGNCLRSEESREGKQDRGVTKRAEREGTRRMEGRKEGRLEGEIHFPQSRAMQKIPL